MTTSGEVIPYHSNQQYIGSRYVLKF